jgi:hypothetical protein
MRGQICRAIEDFVTLGASILHMDDHGTSAKENL